MIFASFFFVLLVFLALIIHSYYLKGSRLTFNFFFFGVLYAARWVFRKRFFPALHTMPDIPSAGVGPESASYINIYNVFSSMTVIFLCVVMLYLSWVIAEKIIKRLNYFQGKIFIAVLVGGLVAASFSYFIEVAGIDFGLWSLRPVHYGSLEKFLMGQPYLAAVSWFYFTVYFLAAFFLIEISKYREKPWKCIFILLAFIHGSIIEFFGGGMPALFERILAFVILVILSIFWGLPFDHFKAKESKHHKSIPLIPGIAVMCIIFIFCSAHALIFKDPRILYALLPLLIFISFSANIRLAFIIASVAVISAAMNIRLAAPALISIFTLIVIIFTGKMRKIYEDK